MGKVDFLWVELFPGVANSRMAAWIVKHQSVLFVRVTSKYKANHPWLRISPHQSEVYHDF